MLILRLALRDLFFQKVHLICNIAVLAGVLVPLLVLFGVKNGVYNALIGQLLSNPRSLQIDTSGNTTFTTADAELVRGWPEAGFVTLKTRSQFDFVNVRLDGGRQKRDAILIPSGAGDPNLPEGVQLNASSAAVSAQLAEQLQISTGDRIDVITQAEDRPRQLRVQLAVASVLPPGGVSGRAVLAQIEVLDLVEAFYDAYALPEHGITEGRSFAQRAAVFEGLRVYARGLEDLAPLQNRIEAHFGIRTEARTAEVQGVLNLGRNLNLALLLTASVASLGLAAALVFGFWGEVQRKRQVLASLALMGLGGQRLWLFPLIQALVSAALALIVSFALLGLASLIAEQLFETGLAVGGLVQMTGAQGAVIVVLVMLFVVASSLFAARAALGIDPATVLREGAT
ncbi:ABC transporter permease family protein [Roseobacter weihaiensis]|uniref:ABC transporter permease n=1 Tax=Roseobacter weihaiensis TaxID=2763262 RepID=UPI001D0A3118|nr:ABC transporter permease [Roseobacter sp. H9]